MRGEIKSRSEGFVCLQGRFEGLVFDGATYDSSEGSVLGYPNSG